LRGSHDLATYTLYFLFFALNKDKNKWLCLINKISLKGYLATYTLYFLFFALNKDKNKLLCLIIKVEIKSIVIT